MMKMGRRVKRELPGFSTIFRLTGVRSMARVMIIGYGPLPGPGQAYLAAPSLRTRQILKPILEAGHTVNLYTLPLPGSEGPESQVPAMMPGNYEGLAYQRFTNHSGEFAIRALTEQARTLEPDAIVGVNTYPAYIGAMMGTAIPLWADLCGFWMAEMQGRCWIEQNDDRLSDAWSIERVVVRRLDKYSAVSRPQLQAVLGELGAVGRLNQYTFQYQFGHHMANAAYSWRPLPAEDGGPDGPLLRGPIVPADAFILLWSGGFGPSCDIPTLMGAVTMLMERHPNVHLVCTGGRVEGGVSQTFQLYEEMVEQSPWKDRIHTLGWVESDRLSLIYREADLGLNVDGRNYETLFGARNRINAMAAEGLPVATTLGSEISEWLDDGRAALTAPMGDPRALAEAIETAIADKPALRACVRNATRIMEEDFSIARTTRSLLDWLRSPRLAPDNQAKIELAEQPVEDLNAVTLNSLEEEALLLMRHRPSELLKAVHEIKHRHTPQERAGFFRIFKSR
jgi:glycosyltransferase involved in cell wall biosynthesis